MTLLLSAVALLLAGAAAALLSGGSSRWATRFGVGGAIAGCTLGAIPAVRVLAGGTPLSLRLPWGVPYGAFFVEVDPLSAFFLLVIFTVSGVAALYGGDYLLHAYGAGEQAGDTGRPLGPAWFFYNLLAASMAVVVIARNGILFLVAWEVMALASFFLVTLDDGDESVREAGRTYLIATHLGTAFLLALFAILGREAGSLDFDRFAAIGSLAPSAAGALFLLGLVGFGAKAGLAPFHVWLPEAHPAAPSHVSAVMSGAMVKVGVYGLLRLLSLLDSPPLWWGWVLVAIGLLSGGTGALFALAQHDLKRLLAYSTVENVGIISIALGIGVIGLASGAPVIAVLGFAGALLHVANHALFKGLLFLGAGAVAHETGTRVIDRLGGLLRRMPATGAAFLIGAVAVCGLPPLNGFASEYLVYLGALRGGMARAVGESLPGLAAAAGLALIGGLAAAASAKAFGIAFLGEPRTAAARDAHDPTRAMRLAMGIFAGGCVAAGFASPWMVRALAPVLATATRLPAGGIAEGVGVATPSLARIVLVAAGTVGLAAALGTLTHRLLAVRGIARAETWGCGYARPTARMQYTGSSFVQPLSSLFRAALRTRRDAVSPAGLYPDAASFETATPDVIHERVVRPAFVGAARGLAKLRWLQHGRLNLYTLYIALTLLILLIWKMG